MACADIPMDIQGSDYEVTAEEDPGDPLIKYYKATEMIPQAKLPLHGLLRKQPAVLGSLQMVSGSLSVGLGVIFAATHAMNASLFVLFRVPLLTGSLYTIAGLLSTLLFKWPRLLSVCFLVNIGCIAVAFVGGVLICIDLVLLDKTEVVDLKVKLL